MTSHTLNSAVLAAPRCSFKCKLILLLLVSFALGSMSVARAAEPAASKTSLEIKSVRVFPFVAKDTRTQPLVISGQFHGPQTTAHVKVDGKDLGELRLAEGPISGQVQAPCVTSETHSEVIFTGANKAVLAKANVVRKPAPELTIYVVPHSHVDIGYTELQPKIEAKQTSNLLTALELIEKSKNNPPGSQYRWTVEAAWTIDNLLRDHPERAAALTKALKNHTVELDSAFANMLTALCRPEELLRCYAWGTVYGAQFGVPVKAAMISDVPGYTWGTIASMSAAGVKYFSIGPNLLDRIGTTLQAWEDRPFYWQTPDGQHQVLCWVSYKGYAWSHIIKVISEPTVADYVERLEKMKYPYDLAMIRWSGHGDNAVPDEPLIDSIKQWNERFEWPKLRISLVSEPFELLEQKYRDKIPVVKGDWTPYWEDGAGSSALETAMNRATSERLVAAETLWSLLQPAKTFPAKDFRTAWRNAMLYSEHTWGAHCSISEPEDALTRGQWDYKRGYAVAADEGSRKLLANAVVGESPLKNTVDVFNTNSWLRTDVLEIPKDLSTAGDCVKDASGKIVPSQRLTSGSLAILASNVPAFSSQRFHISADTAAKNGDAKADKLTVNNSVLSVTVDPTTGNVRECVRSSDGTNLVAPQSNGLNDYIFIEGNHFDRPRHVPPSPHVSVREPGPLVASLQVESDAPGCKKLTREIRLVAGADSFEIVDLLDKSRASVKPASAGGNSQDPNNGKEAVHFMFPFNVPNGEIRMDIPWAVMQPEKDQMPGSCKNWFTVGRWVDVSNADTGVTWAPLDAPLVQVGGITATLIGSQKEPEAWQKHVDPSQILCSWAMNNYWHTNYRAYQEGPTQFRYAIRPHGKPSIAEAQRFGTERSQPLVVAAAADRKPLDVPRLKLASSDVVVTAFKPANDGQGFILRLFAAGGKDVEVPLVWQGASPKAVYQSDLLESKGEKLGSSIHLPAWGVATLRVE